MDAPTFNSSARGPPGPFWIKPRPHNRFPWLGAYSLLSPTRTSRPARQWCRGAARFVLWRLTYLLTTPQGPHRPPFVRVGPAPPFLLSRGTVPVLTSRTSAILAALAISMALAP